ncbi:Gamma-tubulin complex component 6 [Bulinus truncatus]|nr:Gamma-tubulin complex component 6 [Bulinus truncatus]
MSQPKIDRDEAKTALKKVLYNTLFGYLNNKSLKDKKCRVPFGWEKEELLLEVYKLGLQRKYEDADRLEELFNRLSKESTSLEVWNYLKFIVALKNTGDTPPGSNEHVFHFPVAKRNRYSGTVPSGPLNYGDLKKTVRYSSYFMHYPRETFQGKFPELMKENEKSISQILRLPPGKFMGPDCFFTTKFLLGDHYEQTMQSSLFGGLIQGRCTDLEIKLELPAIASSPESKIPEFKCRLSHSESEESGLGSECTSMSSSLVTLVSSNPSGYDDSIWERALTDIRSKHVSWEWRGYQPGPTERPYVTEAGSAVLDLIIQYKRHVSTLLAQENKASHLVTVDADVLMHHLLLMLTGVPSVLFPFDGVNKCFVIIEGLQISGTFPEMLDNVLTEFVNCGTLYVRLREFSQPPVLDSFYTAGLVFQAFCSAIRKFLQQYTAEILSIPSAVTLMQLSNHLYRSASQIKYLAQLCGCCDHPQYKMNQKDFPTGMKLLFYLYEETQMSASFPHYPLFLSVLQTSCAPMILFLRDWIFHGIYGDLYGEFLIKIDENYLDARDDQYWNKAYTLKAVNEQGPGETVPEFLLDIINDIVTCGKSINLLRICNPQHFMCNVSESTVPPVTITFSQSYIRDIQKYCQTYVSRMKQISQQMTEDRLEMLKRTERQKIELQQMARIMAQKEISRLQGIIDERKSKIDAKKRVEFERLKKQMQDDMQRRSGAQEEEREADRQYIARLNKEETVFTEQEIELEKKARDELISYYTELGEDAMQRERIALWRVRRAQLDYSRFLFLEADAKRWQQELLNQKDDVDGRRSPSLPKWAVRVSDITSSLEIGDTEDIVLPSWAEKEYDTIEDNIVLHTDVPLPNWAQRTAMPKDFQTLVVASSDEDLDEGSDGENNLRSENTDADTKMDADSIRSDPVKDTSSELPASESDYKESKPHNQRVGDSHVNDESKDPVIAKPKIKMVRGVSSLTESQESVKRQHIKTSALMSATKESEPSMTDKRTHLKFQQGLQVNQESRQERALVPRKQKGHDSVSTESESKVWAVKKPSRFGHVSQLSNSGYVLTIPKLRRQNHLHANMESSYKDFTIKSHVRGNKKMFASKESVDEIHQGYRPHIRILPSRNANTESEQVDETAVIRKKFLAQNFRGHSSDSTVQKLLYGDVDRLNPLSEDSPDGAIERISFKDGPSYTAEGYQSSFPELAQQLTLDPMCNIRVLDLGKDLVDAVVSGQEEVEAHTSTPLSVLLSCSLTAPIKAQISLVNSAVINYFTTELKVDSHFEAIKRYLFMADGDFAEILANILFEKLVTNPLPQEIINPVFLNGALNKAIRSSIHSDDVNTKNLSFVHKSLPPVLLPNDLNSLQCLQLKYCVSYID